MNDPVQNAGDEEMTRLEVMDPVFVHLRKQDAEISAIRRDIAFLVEINKNLEGLACFIKKWGGRLNRAVIWVAKIGVPLIASYEFFKDPASEWIKKWIH